MGDSSKDEFRNQLANEFSHAADLYRHVSALLDQSEPGLSQVCRALLAEPPGLKGTPDQIADEALRDKPQHVIHLMQWWASHGDFEAGLMSATPAAGKPGFLQTFSKDKGISKAKLENARAKLYGDQVTHPLNWYVHYKEKKWPNTGPRSILCCQGVAEALSAYASGDWKALDDLTIDFFDAVTRSVALRRAMFTDSNGGLSSDELRSEAKELGLTSDTESFAKESLDLKEPVRPVWWTYRHSTMVARPKMRVSGKIVSRTGFLARPKSWLRFASDSRYQTDHQAAQRDKLIKFAKSSWPASDDFAAEILTMLDNPADMQRGLRALKAVAGLLVLAREPSSSEQVEGGTPRNEPPSFVHELQSSLNKARSSAQLTEVRVPPGQTVRRIPSRTAQSKDGLACQLKLDGKVFALIGKLRTSAAPDEIFESVFLYELHSWAVDEVRLKSGHNGLIALVEALKQSNCYGGGWEEAKKTLLSLTQGASAEALEQAFSALWPNVLAFRAVAAKAKSVAEPLFDEVDQLLKEMVHATIQLLHKRGGTTFPPRCSRVEEAGEIDLKRWLAADGCWQNGRSVAIEVRSGAVPQLMEAAAPTRLQMDLPGFDDHNPHDVHLVNMPGVFYWPSGDPPAYVRLIHQHICQPIVAAFSGGSAAPVDFGKALESLRNTFSSGDGAIAFDALVKASVANDDHATQWLDCLRKDSRFQFDRCFPSIEHRDGKWIPSSPDPDATYLKWDYDEHTSAKTLIRVTYALNEANSVAIFSKGPRGGIKALTAADAVNSWCVRVGGNASERGKDIARATERHWAFDHPLGTTVRLVAELLDQIGDAGTIGKTVDGDDVDKLRDDGYQVLKAWLDAVGGIVTPDNWSSSEGSEPRAEERDTLSWAFSSSVPTGRTIVNQFGVKAFDCERPFVGALSAGAPFEGYEDIDDISRTFWNGQWSGLAVDWNTLPALTDKNRRARALYAIYRHLSLTLNVTKESVSWEKHAKERLVSILEAEFGWEPFPDDDEVELGGPSLKAERVVFADGQKAVNGAVVKVIAKGFKQRSDRNGVTQPALVEKK